MRYKDKDLIFAENREGKIIGHNHPGIETFRGSPYYSTARETVQNAIDVRKDKSRPVKISFKISDVKTASIPGIENLKEAFSICLNQVKDQSDQGFYRKGSKLLDNDRVSVLEISDENTEGLKNYSNDDGPSAFEVMLKGEAKSKKEDNKSLGSFGIGKFAPYSVSGLRTVFVQTNYKDDDGINDINLLQSRTILSSFTADIDEEKEFPVIGEGWYGKKGDKFPTSVKPDDDNDCPDWLKRDESMSSGTSLFIMGFEKNDDWKYRFIGALLCNYFIAIKDKIVEFDVDGIIINSENLENTFIEKNLLEASKRGTIKTNKGEKLNDALYKFQRFCAAYTYSLNLDYDSKKDFEKGFYKFSYENRVLGKFSIYLLFETEANSDVFEETPSTISKHNVGFIRNGMFITETLDGFGKKYWKFNSRLPAFYAIVICEDDYGNEILRKLENPQHDTFELSRIKESEKNTIDKAMRDLGTEIKKRINEILEIESNDDDEYHPDWINKYFDLSGDEESNEKSEPSANIIKIGEKKKNKYKAVPITVIEDEDNGELGGSSETEGGKGGDIPGDGSGEGEGSGGTGRNKIILSSNNIRLIKKSSGNDYVLKIKNPTERLFDLSIHAVGSDDNKSINIVSAYDKNGKPLSIQGGLIRGIHGKSNEKISIDISINSYFNTDKFGVICYENW